LINSYGVDDDASIDDVCELIKENKQTGGLAVLTFHDISDGNSNWDVSVDEFVGILECAKKLDVEVDSLSGCMAKINFGD